MKKFKTIFSIIVLTVGFAASAQDVAQSHIDANVPTEADFDRLLNRVVKNYLGAYYKQITKVQCEMLRDGSTQTGIAYPKFYIWVIGLSDNDTVITEGAMRLVAVEKKEFKITDYVTKEQIKHNPKFLEAIFPAALISKIKTNAGIQD